MSFILVYDMRECSDLWFTCSFPAISTQFADKTVFPPHYILFLLPLSKIQWPQVYRFISGLSILFHWFIYLFLCQYCVVLIIVTLQYCLRPGRVKPPVLIVFLRIALVILGLSWVHINFRIICSSSVKNVMCNLREITLVL